MTLARLRAEDREEGIAIGEERGERRKALETARNYLLLGVAPEQVAQGSGLPLPEVQQIAAELGK